MNDYKPKQFPRYGMNILQAVAIGNSTEIIVLMTTSSIDIIIAVSHKTNKIADVITIECFNAGVSLPVINT